MPRKKKAEKTRALKGRPAVERGISIEVVDALLELNPLDEEAITMDSSLWNDLGLDSLDIVELCMALDIDDDRLIEDDGQGVTVSDIVVAWRKKAA